MGYWSKRPQPIPWYKRRVSKSNINDLRIATAVQEVLNGRKWEERIQLIHPGAPSLFIVLVRSTINTYLNLNQLLVLISAALHTARPWLLKDQKMQAQCSLFVKDTLVKLS